MLTAIRLHELLHYDPETGVFTWRVRVSQRMRAGDRAGTINAKGYRIIVIDRRAYQAHRLAWLYMTDEWPPHQVDHRFGVRDDLRWSELRLATPSQNMQNRPVLQNSTTGIKGVAWRPLHQRWQARITVNGKRISLGYYDTPEAAGSAYAEAAAQHHGEFART